MPDSAVRTCARSPRPSPEAALDLEALAVATTAELSDDELGEQLLAIAGIRPYTAAGARV